MRCKLTKRHEVSARPKLGTGIGKRCSKVRAARAALLLFFVNRPIKFIFCGIVFTVAIVSAKAPLRKLARLSFVCLACLFTHIHLCPEMHATTKLVKLSKLPTSLCIALLGILTISPTSPATESMQITTREGPLCECPIWRI